MKSLFITGTDTGVGKTLITALLGLHYQSRGIDVGVMKPFASGCEQCPPGLLSEDVAFLRHALQLQTDGPENGAICPAMYAEPLAPLVAARRSGARSGKPTANDLLASARQAFDFLETRREMVLVEGVGGLLVPIAERDGTILTCRDLINEWNLPVVVVARRTLGTINHTLLTVEALRGREIRGLVFCDTAPVKENDIAAQTSPSIIAEMTGLPIWGQVPFLEDLSREALQHVAQTIKPA